VLAAEMLEALRPRPGARLVDGTLGGGGHARLLLERIVPDGVLLGLDRDPEVVERMSRELSQFGAAFRPRCADFADLDRALEEEGFAKVDGIMADLGLSSLQLADPARGFSFMLEGPLDMRFDPRCGSTAADLLARLPEPEIADLLWSYGGERASRRLARAIVARRKQAPLRTTTELAGLALRAAGRRRAGRRRLHPATRTFQALRIAVNGELDSLERFLDAAPLKLSPGGRLAVVSFHSLEDRRVKNRFRELEAGGSFRRLTRKPVRASAGEMASNPRARSARLRVLERLP
jgi:16S rRNA (cytosine1402-N4)-methyltransferase